MQWVDGVLELYGGPVGFFLRRCTLLKGTASAMTLGHVVLGRDRDALAWTRAHKARPRSSVRAVGTAAPAGVSRGVDDRCAAREGGPTRDNPFEREAYEREAYEREAYEREGG